MSTPGTGYIFAGIIGIVFFTTMGLERVKERTQLEHGAPEALWAVQGKIVRSGLSGGVRKDLEIKVDSDTMIFVGGGAYPKNYAFGTATIEHLTDGEQVTIQVERQKYQDQQIAAQRGKSNKVPIASISTTRDKLLDIDTYLAWRKRESLAGLLLMPSLVLLSLWLMLVGLKARKDKLNGRSKLRLGKEGIHPARRAKAA